VSYAMNVIWKFARHLPLLFIGWHIFLLVVYFPMALWGILVIEIPWLMLYTIAWLIMLRPNPLGYCYLVLFITVNIGWELWISGLLLDEVRLLTYFLPGLFLVYLFFNRNRFGVKAPFSVLALALFGLLLAEATYASVTIDQDKTTMEFGHWSVKDTGYSVTQGGVKWCGTKRLVGRFIVSPEEKTEKRFALGSLDLLTGKLVVIDSKGVFNPSCSIDGQWLSYSRRTEEADKLKKNIHEYLRYHIPTGTSEVLLKYNHRGSNFNNYMSPTGDKMIFLNYPEGMLQIFSVGEPKWSVYQWEPSNYQWEPSKKSGIFRGEWMPDGKTVLVKKPGESVLTISTPEGKDLQEIPFPTGDDKSPYFADDYKIGPDGEYIYFRLNKTRKLYYYRLSNPESGWHLVGERSVHNYAVGPRGVMVFNGVPRGLGYYLYLDGERLTTSGLWLFRPETGETLRLTSGYDEEPSISPDGKTIAFLRGVDKRIISSGASQNDLILLKQR